MAVKVSGPTITALPVLGNKDNWSKNSFLMPSLYGVRHVFNSALNIADPIEFSFTDGLKQLLEQRNTFNYPRHFFQINGIRMARDRISSMAMNKSGIIGKMVGESRIQATVFPIDITMDFHCQDNDAQRMITFIEALAMLTFSPCIGFKVVIEDSFEFMSKINFDEQITVGQFDLETGNSPGSSELVLSFTVYSYIGFTAHKPVLHSITQDNPLVVSYSVQDT